MEKAVLSVQNLSIKHEDALVLSQVSFEVLQGEFVYLIGETGSGKTSLMRTLYADLAFFEGKIHVVDYELPLQKKEDLAFLRRQIGIVFQDFKLLTDRSIEANLAFVLEATGWKDQEAIKKRVLEVLELVKLPESVLNTLPQKLSGGEQQRVAIARALLNKPKIFLADEPTGNLDPLIANAVFEVFEDINKTQQTAVLMATHNHNFLRKKPAKVLFCEDKQLSVLDKHHVLAKIDA